MEDRGAASASWGLGATLSNSVAGYILDTAGYSAALLFLAGCAFAAFLLLWIAMPETGNRQTGNGREASPPEPPNRREPTAPAS